MDITDIVLIQQLEALCYHAVDFEDQSLFDRVFTDDAIFDAQACGGPVCEGMEAIKAFFALGKPPHPPSHNMTNVLVHEVDGQPAVWAKFMVVDRVTGHVHLGDINDLVVRTDKGWRIKQRIARMRYPGELVVSEDVSNWTYQA